MAGSKKKTAKAQRRAEAYGHPESDLAMRPEVGTQAQFRKKKAPKTYRYDSSLSPALDWDGENPARERGEALIRAVLEAESLEEAKSAAAELKALGRPFLDWAGKAERLSFDVPTLPLFVHERLSTKAILETLKGHDRDRQADMFDLFGDPRHSISDQVLRAYEYRDGWVNRLILGDSLVVMNSLLEYEGMGGQVQMIYMDPPYGVRFGSNFQPFVRKRDFGENRDEELTREPEMVKAYRDTWEIGIHSYLSYLRDRFLISRDLLTPSGSIFVQISDDNVHIVRNVLDEVFGSENFVITIPFKKKGNQKGKLLDPVNDYLLWYAKDVEKCRRSYNQLYTRLDVNEDTIETFSYIELPDGRDLTIKQLSDLYEHDTDYRLEPQKILLHYPDAKLFASTELTSGGVRKNQSKIYRYKGRDFDPGLSRGNCWKHTAITEDGSPSGMDRLAAAGRLFVAKDQLRFRRYLTDFGYQAVSNWWDGLGGAKDRVYVVQTSEEVVKRCILMTTRPGDLVLDPTCGGGTTAYVAEKWGRRWITIDTSRVPIALTRQRILTGTFKYFSLKDDRLGPASGFVYQRRRNRKGHEIGGIVAHITSSTIANDEPSEEAIILDRPEKISKTTRISGPFVVEATIPTPVDWEGDGVEDSGAADDHGSFVERMIETLRHSPVLRLPGNREVKLKGIRPPARALVLSAEAIVEATTAGRPDLRDALSAADEKNAGALPLSDKAVAIVCGPENGSISEKLVYEAAREAHAKSYAQLFVMGFGIEPNARKLVEECMAAVGIPAVYVQITPDVAMGDLLKTMRTSQIFSLCALPDVELIEAGDGRCQARLLGLDVFDPVSMETTHRGGKDVPAWFLDTDYNGLCFHVSQAFFPRTGAWDDIRKSLGATYEESVWDHLAGDTSAPFEPGTTGKVAVKVIDDRGNELMVVKDISEARKAKKANA